MTSNDAAERSEPRGRQYRGQPEVQRREERRGRILAAGLEGFADAGNSAPSVADVCARAGVSKRYFYELYDDRLDLLRALHAEAIAWVQDGFDADSHPSDPTSSTRIPRWTPGWSHWRGEITGLIYESTGEHQKDLIFFAKMHEDPIRGRILAISPAHLDDAATRTLAHIVVEGLVQRVGCMEGGPLATEARVRRHAVAAVMAGRALVVEWLATGPSPSASPSRESTAIYLEDTVSAVTSTLTPVLPPGSP